MIAFFGAVCRGEEKQEGEVSLKRLHSLFTVDFGEFWIIKRLRGLSALQLIGHTVYNEFH